jgi:hypothetical protein
LILQETLSSALSLEWVAAETKEELRDLLLRGDVDIAVGTPGSRTILLFDLLTSIQFFYKDDLEGTFLTQRVLGVESSSIVAKEILKLQPFFAFDIRRLSTRAELLQGLADGSLEVVALDYLEEAYEANSLNDKEGISSWVVPNYAFYLSYENPEYDFLKKIIETADPIATPQMVPGIRRLMEQNNIRVEVYHLFWGVISALFVSLALLYIPSTSKYVDRKGGGNYLLFLAALLSALAFYFTPFSFKSSNFEFFFLNLALASLFPITLKFKTKDIGYGSSKIFLIGFAASFILFFGFSNVDLAISVYIFAVLISLFYTWLLILPQTFQLIKKEFLVGLVGTSVYLIYFIIGIQSGFFLGIFPSLVGVFGVGALFFSKTFEIEGVRE